MRTIDVPQGTRQLPASHVNCSATSADSNSEKGRADFANTDATPDSRQGCNFDGDWHLISRRFLQRSGTDPSTAVAKALNESPGDSRPGSWERTMRSWMRRGTCIQLEDRLTSLTRQPVLEGPGRSLEACETAFGFIRSRRPQALALEPGLQAVLRRLATMEWVDSGRSGRNNSQDAWGMAS